MDFIASFFTTAPDPRVLAATMQSNSLENMLDKDPSKVAQVYPWVADLKACRIPNYKIVEAMIKTENVTWMEGPLNLDDEDFTWRETPERKELPRHLDHLENGCVHRLLRPTESNQRITSDEAESTSLPKTVDSLSVFTQREQVVFKHCGIGGVLHPESTVVNNHGLVNFRGNRVSIIYGDEINGGGETIDWFQLDPNPIPFWAVGPLLGDPVKWHQYTKNYACLSSSPEDIYWKSSLFNFFRGSPKRENWHEGLLKYNVSILKELLLAMKDLNKLGGCCKSFPIFTMPDNSSRLTAVDITFESIWEFIGLLCKPLATTDPQSVLRDADWRRKICQWTFDTFRELFGSDDEATSFLYQSTRMNGIATYVTHMVALFAQIFSVGITTFCRGHCSDFYFPLLSRTIENIHLFGTVPAGPRVIVERVNLSCLGDMLHSPVWVFRLKGSLQDQSYPALMSRKRYNIQARLSQIFDIWGASIVFYEKEQSKSVKIRIGDGFLSLSKTDGLLSHLLPFDPVLLSSYLLPSDPILHWSAIDNGGTVPVSYLDEDRKVIVGAVSINLQCPLRFKHCENPLAGILVDLRTRPATWITSSRSGGGSIGLGGGPMAPASVSITGSATQQRSDPIFMKMSQVQQWDKSHDLTVLNAPWGVEFSLCTGVARRVPLRTLLNETVVDYLQSKLGARNFGNGQVIAPTLDRTVIAQIQQAATNKDAAAIWTVLKAINTAQFNAIAFALEIFMDAVRCSRVDKKALLLWWPEPDRSTDRGIKFDSSWCNGNSWVPILEDTETCAIFGLATCTCLTCVVSKENDNTTRACNNSNGSAEAPEPLKEKQFILHTGIAAEGEAGKITRLRLNERLILNSHKAERHTFKVRGTNKSAPFVLEYRGLWSRPAITLYNLFNQDSQMRIVRESAEYIETGLEVLIVDRQP